MPSPPSDPGGLPIHHPADGDAEPVELRLKRLELERLHQEAVDLALKRDHLEGDIQAFIHGFLLDLGALLVRRDALEAKLAALLLERRPADPVLNRRAQESRVRAEKTRGAHRDAVEKGPVRSTPLPPEVRKAYHRAARRMHPDLGDTEAERERRHGYMVRLNAAYQRGDVGEIQELIAFWDASAPPPPQETHADALGRITRAIARLRRTLRDLERALEDLRARPEYRLMLRARQSALEGRDFLREHAARLESRIRQLERAVREGGGDPS